MTKKVKFIFMGIAFLITACNSSQKGKWSDDDKERFITEVKSVKELDNFGDNKQKWVDCYLQKCEANYESYDDANADEDGVEKIAMQCAAEVMANGSVKGKWSQVDINSFRKDMESIDESNNFGDYKKDWIDCYLEKCQAKYSSYYEANNDTVGCTKLAYECNDSIFKLNE